MFKQGVKLAFAGLIAFIFWVPLGNQALALDGSIAVQGGVAGGWDSNGKPLIAGFGFSGHVAADVNLSPAFALGLGQDVNVYVNNSKRLYSDGTDLLARWSPLNRTDWNPYLLAGAGFRPLYELIPDHRWWKGGDFHGTVGVGVRHPVLKGMDLDLTAFYEMNPASSVLNSLGARVGVAFPFSIGSGNSKAVKANPEQAAASAQATTSPTTTDKQTMSGYQVQKGDSLWGISRQNYGAGHEWKKIYDANGNEITDPSLIYPAQQIVIPGATGQGPATQGK